MHRLLLIGITWAVLISTCIAAEYDYDTGMANDQADQIESDTRQRLKDSKWPDQTNIIIGRAQMEYSRALIRQNNEIIQQNKEIIQQNKEVIRLLRNIPRK